VLDRDGDLPGSRPPSDPVWLLAVRAVEIAAWTATLALAGLVVGPVLALAALLTRVRWLAHAAPAAAKAALALTALAAALALVAIVALTVTRFAEAPDTET